MKKIISILLVMTIILSLGVVNVFAEEAEVPDWSKIDEYLEFENNSIFGNRRGYIEYPFTAIDSRYGMIDDTVRTEDREYCNVISEDGTFTVTNNAPSDKYLMYITLMPYYNIGNGQYSSFSDELLESVDYDIYTHFYLFEDGDFSDDPIDVLHPESGVEILYPGESVTFSIPKSVKWFDMYNTYEEEIEGDIIWRVIIDTVHGEYGTIDTEYGSYEEFIPTNEDNWSWINWWYYKVDNNAVARINSEPELDEKSGFNDVKSGDYFYEPVIWAVEKEITKGTSLNTFSPNDTCTQAQILTFLWRAAGEPVSDVKYLDNDAYYVEALNWAINEGIVDKDVNPDSPCTRMDTVKYLYLQNVSEEYVGTSADVMTDIKEENKFMISWAMDNGITMGTSDTTFSPDDICTRGQIATFLYRAFVK